MKIILVFLVALIATLVISVPKILRLGGVGCASQFGPCSQALTERLNSFNARPIGKARTEISELLTKETLVKDFSIQFKLPNLLSVNLLERKPKFALKLEEVNILALVDEEGYIVSMQDSTNLPTVAVPGKEGAVGEKVSNENLFALTLISDLFTFYQVRQGKVENDALLVNLNEGTKVIFPLSGDREVLISSLLLVLKRFEAEGKATKEIDLRYKNPVIRE